MITEQQRLIQSLQRELMRLQKRLTKVEIQGIVQPSIMFTRLDAERNEKVLQQAADKGKIPETTVTVRNDHQTMVGREKMIVFLFFLLKGTKPGYERIRSLAWTTIQ